MQTQDVAKIIKAAAKPDAAECDGGSGMGGKMSKARRDIAEIVKRSGGQVPAAAIMGIGQNTLSRYLHGREPMPAVARLAEVLIQFWDELVEYDEEPKGGE